MSIVNAVVKASLFLVLTVAFATGPAHAQTDVTATLFKGARTGDLKSLAASLENTADVNASDRNGNTPLIMAAEKGHVQAVRFLIENGADVQAADKNGRTSLMAVCNAEVAELLIIHGARLEVVNRNGWTPLLYAAVHRNTPVIKTLVSKGAAVNAADRSGRTALMMLSGKGDRAAIEFLLANGADTNLTDSHGQTALMAAAREGRTLIAALLIQHGADVSMKEKFGKTARDIAKEHKIQEMTDFLKNPKRAPELLKGTGAIRLDDAFLEGLIDEKQLKKAFVYAPAVQKKTRVLSGGTRGNVSIQGTVLDERWFSCSVNIELHESASHAARYCQATSQLTGNAMTGTIFDVGRVGDKSTVIRRSTSNAILSFTVDHILVNVTLMAPEDRLVELGKIGRAVEKRLRGER